MQQYPHPRCISAAPAALDRYPCGFAGHVARPAFANATAWQARSLRKAPASQFRERRTRVGNLFPPQRHHDLFVVARQNYLAILDSLDHDLVNLSADLEAELLTFLHRFAIDDGKMRAAIDRDSANDECAGRNFALIGSATATGNFSSRLPADWPKWITGSGVEIEGRFIFDRDGGGFIRAEQSLRREDQGEEKWKKYFHRFSITVVAAMPTC